MRFAKLGIWAAAIWTTLVVGLGAPTLALAGPIVTVTAVGTITSASGDAAALGATDPLIGKSVTMVQTMEVTPTASLFPGSDFSIALFDLVAVSVSIDGGAAVQFAGLPSTSGGIYTVSTLASGLAQVDSQITINDLQPGQVLAAGITISSAIDDFISTAALLISRSFSAAPASGSWSFGASLLDANGGTLWDFLVNDVDSLTVLVSSVPEPSTLLVVMLAFGLLLAASRRERRTPGRA